MNFALAVNIGTSNAVNAPSTTITLARSSITGSTIVLNATNIGIAGSTITTVN